MPDIYVELGLIRTTMLNRDVYIICVYFKIEWLIMAMGMCINAGFWGYDNGQYIIFSCKFLYLKLCLSGERYWGEKKGL